MTRYRYNVGDTVRMVDGTGLWKGTIGVIIKRLFDNWGYRVRITKLNDDPIINKYIPVGSNITFDDSALELVGDPNTICYTCIHECKKDDIKKCGFYEQERW
jgi:hypothetical protein